MKKFAKKLFQLEARLILKKYKPKIIAITGSVGKTTTRDFLYSVLSKKFFTRKSEKSFTTELGLPLTILGRPRADIVFALRGSSFLSTLGHFLLTLFFGLKLLVWRQNYPAWLILEIDADKPGDTASLEKWLSIDILIMTAIGAAPSHIEAFDSDLEKFLTEKKKVLDCLSRDGTIFYNTDDETTSRLVAERSARKVACGLSGDCDWRGSDFEILSSNVGGLSRPTGMRFDVVLQEGSLGVGGTPHSPSVGPNFTTTILNTASIHNEYAALLSLAVASSLGLSLSEAVKAIEKSALLPGRMKIIAGLKDSTIIDDSYNSSPIAARQAVEVFGRTPTTGRKIAVIGDMLELGKFSAEEHRELGRMLSSVACCVICVGLRARRVAEAMLELSFDEKNIFCFDTTMEAGKFLQNMLAPGDLILVKGSQAMRLEKTVLEIMRHPEDAHALLVRQEPEWLSRD